MVEAGASEVTEDVMVEALMFGHNEIKKLCRLQKEMYLKMGIAKREVVKPELDQPMLAEIESRVTDALRDALDTTKHEKLESYALVDKLKEESVAAYPEDDPDKRKMAGKIFTHLKGRSSARHPEPAPSTRRPPVPPSAPSDPRLIGFRALWFGQFTR